ncbi:GNAT family N-acetyltransferase [Demequina sp. SYSU T00192]|uniref:GNAT family N-acetyltransferase n=1 Tax=Demequina litoralis TaxID=3051660 RepID=A0ABT8GB81_9MICO|nr:GNAT family N-acetyltransferase [Demequina sp. SYSU T00192]MDN4476402.1 GNAT family N-acetyltransferase [Demequina sp. SYSU T00192]
MQISVADPAVPDVVALLTEHLADMHATSPAESVHALDVERLRATHVTFLTARADEGGLMGVGALAELGDGHAEVKSMRTAHAHRGAGVAAAVLGALIEAARSRGCTRVSLETGTEAYFAAAHRLYERAGFTPCGPFGSYTEDPHSRFYTLAIDSP